MESEDDIYDAADYEPIDADYEPIDNEFDRQEENCTVLKEEDIRKRQNDDILRVSTVLSVSRDSACMLLRRYNWSVSNVNEAWFADEDGVREAVGLLKKPIVRISNSTADLTCGICFDIYPIDMIETISCGHPYCITCWKSYISTSINDGSGCLMLKCPDLSCNAAMVDVIDKLGSDEEKEKYHHYILRSYIESNRRTKWCPAAGCDCAVEYVVGSGSYDVSCLCSYSFCWNCTEEAHRPVDCDTVAKWILKNNSESESVNWILANSKPCPKCKRPIEKNQGCMHMTCRPPCYFEFCWICLSPVKGHGACNRYGEEFDKAEKKRNMAKKSIERYTHYYERWASNHSSWQKANADLNKTKTVTLEILSEKQSLPVTELDFIIKAWVQIVECRRVLKWTYAYGYYLPKHEKAKKQLFEYLQGEAEAGLERLHQCAEKELETYLNEPSDDFNEHFRRKLTGLTSVTKNFFDNLVRALENGLSDVESSAPKKRKHRRGISDDLGYWACDQCTYLNHNSTTRCDTCLWSYVTKKFLLL